MRNGPLCLQAARNGLESLKPLFGDTPNTRKSLCCMDVHTEPLPACVEYLQMAAFIGGGAARRNNGPITNRDLEICQERFSLPRFGDSWLS